MCGITNDSGLDACGNGNCVDKVNGITCDCDEDCEFMVNDSQSDTST